VYSPVRAAPEYQHPPEYPYSALSATASPHRSSSEQPLLPPVSPIQRNRHAKGEVSPGRAQPMKKRRTEDEVLPPTSPVGSVSTTLSRDMQTRLILHDHAVEVSHATSEVASPTGVLQSRSRRAPDRHSSPSRSGHELSGLAALSSAALLKLHEATDEDK
jgi:hypothetical protein